MLNRITAYCLFIFGFLIFLFFRHYTGNLIPYPWIFIVVGIMMFLAGYFLLRYSSPSQNKANLKQLHQLINDLKSGGEKISVDFKDCEIRGQSYTGLRSPHGADSQLVELTVSPILHKMMDHLDDPRGDGKVSVEQSVIVFHYNNPRSGQTEKFISQVIPKDQVSLSFYLDQQKQTTLYVDKTDRTLFYFDLAFLYA